MTIVEEIDHSFWKRVLRLDGYEGWHCLIKEPLDDGILVPIRIEFDDPNDITVQQNYIAIRERWPEIWPRIQNRTRDMKAAYGFGDTPICPESDWFELKPPIDPIESGAEWSVMLQAQEAGWLLDFTGWEDAGGQGVF